MQNIIKVSPVAIDRPLSLIEAGQAADVAAAQGVFARHLGLLSQNTRNARKVDLATWNQYLVAANVLIADCDWYNDPFCWKGVTAGLVNGFVQWMLKGGYSISAVNRKTSTVKIFCRMASEAKVIDGGEMALISEIKQIRYGQGVELDRQRESSRRGVKKAASVELTNAQSKALKALPGDTPQDKRDRLLFYLMLDQAMRVSEVAVLAVEHFNVQRSTVTFYRPKIKRTETHRLTPGTLDALIDYLECEGAPASGPVLLGSNKVGKLAGTMGERSITRRVNVIGKELLGIDNLSAHDLRHNAATRAARGGTSVTALMGLGGWTSAATAMRYVDRQKIANDGVKFEE